jgi:acyl-CoA synthetase (AMP-forming)/AMP-acid ligase II
VTPPHLDRCMVGGTALPPAVQKAFKDVHGVRVVHLWGVPYGVEIEVRDSTGGAVLDANGWFPTGDVATWDRCGYMKITDRTNDVIKSGGEWISSIDVENAAMAHPKIALAATVAAFHPRWDERPVLVILPLDGQQPTSEEVLEFLAPHMAKWWLPDDVVFVKEMPMTATGRIPKAKLREQHWHHLAG